jgi:hypothetical protein
MLDVSYKRNRFFETLSAHKTAFEPISMALEFNNSSVMMVFR